MPLEMKTVGKAVHFRYDDGEATTVVVVSSEDDDGAKLRKLKRVIALVEGKPEPAGQNLLMPRLGDPALLDFPTPNALRRDMPPPAAAPPPLPARLKGQWDLEEPSGPVGKGWEVMGDDLPSAPGEGA